MTLESHWLENCIYYDSRVVIYERKMFCRIEHRFWNKKSQKLIQKLLFVLNKRCFHNSPRGCQIYFDYFFGKFVTNSCLKRWKENEKEASTEDRPFSINIWPPRPTCSKSVRPLRQNCLKNVWRPRPTCSKIVRPPRPTYSNFHVSASSRQWLAINIPLCLIEPKKSK